MTDSQKWMLIAGFALTALLLYLIAPVLTPFLVSALIAYLCDPLVDRLETRMPRTLAVIVVFIAAFSVLLLLLLWLVPMIERQITAFLENFPRYIDWIQDRILPWLERHLGVAGSLPDIEALQRALARHWRETGGLAAGMMASLSQSGLAFLAALVNIALIPVVTFYLLREWDDILVRIRRLLPRPLEPTVTQIARECDDALGGFLRGQLSVMVILGVIYATGLWLVGLDLALLIGMIAGLVNFIPYLGFAVGLLLAGIAAVAQFQDFWHLFPVLAVFSVGQILESMVLTPYIVGDRIGLHPVAVIFAVMVGGQLFGFSGMLLALPVSAVLMVLLRHATRRYKDSELYQSGS